MEVVFNMFFATFIIFGGLIGILCLMMMRYDNENGDVCLAPLEWRLLSFASSKGTTSLALIATVTSLAATGMILALAMYSAITNIIFGGFTIDNIGTLSFLLLKLCAFLMNPTGFIFVAFIIWAFTFASLEYLRKEENYTNTFPSKSQFVGFSLIGFYYFTTMSFINIAINFVWANIPKWFS